MAILFITVLQEFAISNTFNGVLKVTSSEAVFESQVRRLCPNSDVSAIGFDDNHYVFTLDPHNAPKAEFSYIAWPSKLTYKVQKIKNPEGFEFDNAFMSGESLVLPGHIRGNGPSPGVALYKRQSGKWTLSQFQSVMFECWDDVKFTRQGLCWTANCTGTTYPKHMSVSHSIANVRMKREFLVRNGRLLPTKDYEIPSPMGILDAYLGKHVTAREICASDSIARKLRLVLPELSTTGWRCNYERVAKQKAAIFATTARLRFEFENRNDGWFITNICHGNIQD